MINDLNNMQVIIRHATKNGASDIHMLQDSCVAYRIDGSIKQMKNYTVQKDDILNYFESVGVAKSNLDKLDYGEISAIDTSFNEGGCRYRANIYRTNKGICVAIRSFYEYIPDFDELYLPNVIKNYAMLRSGLVIITGVTGSGKSTTLASLIKLINNTRSDNIITIEDPIEYLHENKKCRIVQREKGRDFYDFNTAVKEAMRQDPDVILVGEMRDVETIRNTITLAETGHLVFGTLHASSTIDVVDRLVDAFSANEKEMMRGIVSDVLKGVVYQYLVKRQNGVGRVPLCEVLTVDNIIKGALRENNKSAIIDRMRTSEATGCIEFVDRCAELVHDGSVNKSDIYKIIDDNNIDYFDKKLKALGEFVGLEQEQTTSRLLQSNHFKR